MTQRFAFLSQVEDVSSVMVAITESADKKLVCEKNVLEFNLQEKILIF